MYKLNANSDKEAIYLRRKLQDGKDSLEKIWRKRCPRCELIGGVASTTVEHWAQANPVDISSVNIVAYETTDPRDKKVGSYSFILAGALSEEQTAIPADAFGEETAKTSISV